MLINVQKFCVTDGICVTNAINSPILIKILFLFLIGLLADGIPIFYLCCILGCLQEKNLTNKQTNSNFIDIDTADKPKFSSFKQNLAFVLHEVESYLLVPMCHNWSAQNLQKEIISYPTSFACAESNYFFNGG